MLRISALNSDSSEDESCSVPVTKATTKEAQECEVFSLYNQALSLERQGLKADAKQSLQTVLQQKIVQQAVADENEGQDIRNQSDGGSRPILALKYSAYKNLAAISYQEENWNQAIEYYLEAVLVDATEVSVWYKIGTLAMKIHNYALARHSFEQGLLCNSHHWPCLDNVITIMFALGNYQMCLYYISKALARDAGYVKGLVFKKQIYDEMPMLQRDTMHFFSECDSSIYDTEVEEEEIQEYVSEAVNIRDKRRELSRPPKKPELDFLIPLKHTWQSLGECLISLYDYVYSELRGQNSRNISFTCRVKLAQYLNKYNTDSNVQPQTLTVSSVGVPTVALTPEVTNFAMEAVTPSHQTTPMTATDMEVDTVTDTGAMSEEAAFNKRPGKRKRLWALQEEFGGKRRSTRVRNVITKKQEESINYQELLAKFLPQTLRFGRESDDSATISSDVMMDSSSSASQSIVTDNNLPNKDVAQLSSTEEDDVMEFLQKYEKNGGVLSLMRAYLLTLCSKCTMKWPETLTDTYLNIGERYRKHLQYPDYLCRDISDSQIKKLAKFCLLMKELKVDKWMKDKTKLTGSAGTSPRKSPGRSFSPDFPGEYFTSDLDYLCGVSCLKDVLQQDWRIFKARAEWVCGKFMLLENKLDYALDHFHGVVSHLKSTDTQEVFNLWLPNIAHDSLISIGEVLKQVESLERCQSLEVVHRLHEAGDHVRVVELLLQTFTLKQGKLLEDSDRMEQLILLQESLMKLKDFGKCIVWSEVSFHESLKRYHSAASKSLRQEWLSTVITLMAGMNKCLISSPSVIKHLPSINLMRLTQNLLWLLDVAMDVPDNMVEMNISTPLPWILLYRLIDHEEKLVDKDLDELPSAIMLLNFAHECLGRRSWCVSADGGLLLFIAEEFVRLLRQSPVEEPHPFKDDLEESIEQAFYCLYGHPNKRTKAKHLQDHNVPQIELTWGRAAILFDCFKPKSIPEYDSYRTSTVSAELENLLKRIILLIPPQVGLTGLLEDQIKHLNEKTFVPSSISGNTIESVTSYIEGTSPHPPSVTDNKYIQIVSEIYYLLADYYFKNKESGKAIKFYLHDLCVNPERFDSWAGMALARSSRLEQRLNSHELKNEPGTILKQANSALCCFRRALQLDNCNSKLWIEYGNLAYQVHSYLSRTLKQHPLFPLTEDALELTKKNKAEMLRVASSCYNKAGRYDEDGTEEPWLQHYMSGKIAEKMGENPEVFLQHYKQSAECLHEERAKYPKKITYILSPPFLSVESLEVFYRLHVSIIKFLIKNQHLVTELSKQEKSVDEKKNSASSQDERANSTDEIIDNASDQNKDVSSENYISGGDKSVSEDKAQECNVATDKLFLDVLEKYVDESLKGPFALSQEKEKPKVKITNERLDMEGSDNWCTPVNTAGKVRTPTRASRLDHTYSSMSRKRQRLSDTSQESPLAYLSNMTSLSSAPSSGFNTPVGSVSPHISDMSFATPSSLVMMSKLGCTLPLGITPLAGLATMAQSLTTVASTVNSVVSTTSSHVTAARNTPRRPSLSFSMDSILGLSSPSPKKTDEDSSPTLKQKTDKIVLNENILPNHLEQKKDRSLQVQQESSTTEVRNIIEQTDQVNKEVESLLKDIVGKIVNLPNEKGENVSVVEIEDNPGANDKTSSDKQTNKIICKSEKSIKGDGVSTEETESKPAELVSVEREKTDKELNDKSKEIINEESEPVVEKMDTSEIISEQKELCQQRAKTPTSESNVLPPKLMSPDKQQGSVERPMPVLEKEMPILEKMECENEDKDIVKKNEVSIEKECNKCEESSKRDNEQDNDGLKEEDKREPKAIPLNEWYCQVIKKAMKALEICLSRFPQHYKSLYRLAQIYYTVAQGDLHDTTKSCDILFGNTGWSELSHMPCVGLFQERKQTNFFQGLWRIPVEDIDRSGSFATHIAKALWLLLDVLKELKDYKALYQVHIGLNKTPEQGKKYLRDSERTLLARTAYTMCFEQIKEKVSDGTKILDQDTAKKFLLEVHKYWQHGVRQQIEVKKINGIFTDVYKVTSGNQGSVVTGASELESAIKYCSQMIAQSKPAAQTSTNPRLTQTTTDARQSPAIHITAETTSQLSTVPVINKTQSVVEYQANPPVSKSILVTTAKQTENVNSEGSQDNQLTELNPNKLTSDMQEMLGDVAAMASNTDIFSMFKLTPDELDQFLEDEEEMQQIEDDQKESKETTKDDNNDLEVIVIDESNIEINFSPKKISPKLGDDKQSAKEDTDIPGPSVSQPEDFLSNSKTENVDMILSEVTGQLIPAISKESCDGKKNTCVPVNTAIDGVSDCVSHPADVKTKDIANSIEQMKTKITPRRSYLEVITGSNITVTISQDESSISENESVDESTQSSHPEAESSDDVIVLSSSE